jgi:hypothetical protein
VARTLCDLSGVVPERTLAIAVEGALRRRLVTVRLPRRVADDLAGPGRRRSTVMRRILEERQPGYEPGGSAPEVRVARLLMRAGLPQPVPQLRLKVDGKSRRLDLAYPELKIAIEYDGWEYHSQRSAFDADRVRGNELEIVGWTVLRFTSTSSDDVIVRTVAAALARAARS